MRTIKFRQPIFVKGKFEEFHYWGFVADGVFVGPEVSIMSIREALEQSQQFTGLKDKNGVEIYEGDIVKQGNSISEVVYEAPCFIMKPPTQIYEKAKDPEVIGNIYENKDLL